VKCFAECELATDSVDGVEDRPLFRGVFQNPEAAKASTADSDPMNGTDEDDVAVNRRHSGANPRSAPRQTHR